MRKLTAVTAILTGLAIPASAGTFDSVHDLVLASCKPIPARDGSVAYYTTNRDDGCTEAVLSKDSHTGACGNGQTVNADKPCYVGP